MLSFPTWFSTLPGAAVSGWLTNPLMLGLFAALGLAFLLYGYQLSRVCLAGLLASLTVFYAYASLATTLAGMPIALQLGISVLLGLVAGLCVLFSPWLLMLVVGMALGNLVGMQVFAAAPYSLALFVLASGLLLASLSPWLLTGLSTLVGSSLLLGALIALCNPSYIGELTIWLELFSQVWLLVLLIALLGSGFQIRRGLIR